MIPRSPADRGSPGLSGPETGERWCHSASLRLPLSAIFMEGGETFMLFAALVSVERTSVVSRAYPSEMAG